MSDDLITAICPKCGAKNRYSRRPLERPDEVRKMQRTS